MSKVSWEMAL